MLLVDPAACQTAKGVVSGPSGQKLAYADLVEAAAKRLVPDFKTVTLKKDPELTIVGTSPRRLDFPAKINGSAQFGIDVRVPGMLYAVIARCPTFGGRAKQFNAAAAKSVPGVRDVVQIEPLGGEIRTSGGIAVVADDTWAAIQGRKKLEVDWDLGPSAAESSAT